MFTSFSFFVLLNTLSCCCFCCSFAALFTYVFFCLLSVFYGIRNLEIQFVVSINVIMSVFIPWQILKILHNFIWYYLLIIDTFHELQQGILTSCWPKLLLFYFLEIFFVGGSIDFVCVCV